VLPVQFLTVIGLISPRGIAVGVTNSLVVVDSDLRAVVRVDPVEGSAAIIAATNVGCGPPFIKPLAMVVEAAGALIIVDRRLKAVVRVDPHTGDRAIVSGCADIDAEGRCVGGIIGCGPPFDFPVALAVEAVGSLVIVDTELDAVVRVNPQTGNRAIESDAGIGNGLPLFFPVAIAVEAAGSLVVIDREINAVVRVDLHTGNRAIISIGAE
jgi:sugar lactone lactonase YvrE